MMAQQQVEPLVQTYLEERQQWLLLLHVRRSKQRLLQHVQRQQALRNTHRITTAAFELAAVRAQDKARRWCRVLKLHPAAKK
jgi:hypothetical protein